MNQTQNQSDPRNGPPKNIPYGFPRNHSHSHGVSLTNRHISATCPPNPQPWATQGRCFIIMSNKKSVKEEWSLPVNYHWIWGSFISVPTAFLVTTAAMEQKRKDLIQPLQCKNHRLSRQKVQIAGLQMLELPQSHTWQSTDFLGQKILFGSPMG